MDKKQLNEIAKWAGIIIAIVTAVFALLGSPITVPQVGIGTQAISETRFRSVYVDHTLTTDDLAVTDDATITDDLAVTGLATVGETLGVTGAADFASTVQMGTNNRYAMQYASSDNVMYVGITAAFTGTASVLSTTHGASTSVTMVLCTMTAPDEDAGDAYFCVGSVTDGDVTLTAIDDDGGTATEASTTAYYIIVGN